MSSQTGRNGFPAGIEGDMGPFQPSFQGDLFHANMLRPSYSTAGVGRPQHICMEQIALKRGLKWTHIPFNSGGESVTACLGGHADGTSQGSADLIPYTNAGKLKLLVTL